MKIFIICCLCATLSMGISGMMFENLQLPVEPVASGLDGESDPKLFQQILDHNSNDNATYWNQRYYVNTAAWKKLGKSPVFLMVSGESEMRYDWMLGGAWVVWAYKFGSLLFQLEHRFYGQSHPTADASDENLQYLSSEQAIGDISYFIKQMSTQYNLTADNKWILFGCSYPAALAAWARLKLQDQVYGVVSSSGPVEAKYDFYEHADVIRTSLDTYSPGCSSQVTTAIKSIEDLLKTPSGVKTVVNKFNICPGFNSSDPQSVGMFYQMLYGPFVSAVQYNNIGGATSKISYVCGYMMNTRVRDPVDRLAALKKSVQNQCIATNNAGTVAWYKQTGWNDGPVSKSNRQWQYQTCNEFGYFYTSNSSTSFFSDTLPVTYYTTQCNDIYGNGYTADKISAKIDNTNQNYGGLNINVDRVVYMQGSVDPWHPLGMVTANNPESPLLYIQGTAHCQDQMTPKDSDPPSLKAARKKAEDYLAYWLS